MAFAGLPQSFVMSPKSVSLDVASHRSLLEAGCLFTGPANAGACTGAAGILSYSEIQSAINGTSAQKKRAAATVVWDKDAAVKYAYWGDQWVSYDDGDTFKQKIDYANKLGLGGMLIWAIDQDSGNYDAINAVSGTTSIHNTKLAVRADGQTTMKDIDTLAGTCRPTECAKDPKCPSGFSPIATRSKPDKLTAQCKKGQKQMICCPSNNMPQSCRWAGDSPNCRTKGHCESTEQELARDSYGDGSMCTQGDKALCCLPQKKTTVDPLKQCKWFGTAPGCSDAFCNDPSYPVQVTTGSGLGANGEFCFSNHKVFCCPNTNTYLNCEWTGSGSNCFTTSCPKGKVPITNDGGGDKGYCWIGNNRNYCCDAPKGPAPNDPLSQNGHWGSLKDEGCKSDGYRQWSSKLLDISGSWENACENHPGWIKETYFLKPTSCDKSVFGIWGKFWVPDDKCCSKSTKRTLRPEDYSFDERSLVPRSPPAQCTSSGFVHPDPINPANAVVALSVFQLMASPVVRQVLQNIWNFAFVSPNMATETGAFFFQHRTQPANIIIYTGYLGRGGGALLDQRFPDPNRMAAFDMEAPGLIPGDILSYPQNPGQIVGTLADYTLIAVAHTHPFLFNLRYGLDPRPSESDHIAAWRYGIPMLVVTRQGTYVAGPTTRITRSGPNDRVLTQVLNAGEPRFERTFWIIPQDQIFRYEEDAFHPFDGNLAFTPTHAPNQLNEPTNGVPLMVPGLVLQAPNPQQGNEQIGPGPGP